MLNQINKRYSTEHPIIPSVFTLRHRSVIIDTQMTRVPQLNLHLHHITPRLNPLLLPYIPNQTNTLQSLKNDVFIFQGANKTQ